MDNPALPSTKQSNHFPATTRTNSVCKHKKKRKFIPTNSIQPLSTPISVTIQPGPVPVVVTIKSDPASAPDQRATIPVSDQCLSPSAARRTVSSPTTDQLACLPDIDWPAKYDFWSTCFCYVCLSASFPCSSCLLRPPGRSVQMVSTCTK